MLSPEAYREGIVGRIVRAARSSHDSGRGGDKVGLERNLGLAGAGGSKDGYSAKPTGAPPRDLGLPRGYPLPRLPLNPRSLGPRDDNEHAQQVDSGSYDSQRQPQGPGARWRGYRSFLFFLVSECFFTVIAIA
jgi:hypothetical protein